MSYEYLCLKSDPPSEGKVLELRTISGQTVAVQKEQDGLAFVYSTACKHMGYHLVRNDRLCSVCPAHRMKHSKSDLVLPSFEAGGMIFLGSSDNKFQVEAEIGSVMNMGPSLSEFARVKTTGAFRRQMWMENTLDTDHVAFAHRGGFADVLDLSSKAVVERSSGNSVMFVGVHERATRGLERLLEYPVVREFRQAAVGPNLSVTSFCNIFFSVERVWDGHADTRFFVRNDLTPSKPHLWERFLVQVAASNRRILEEDAALLRLMDHEAYLNGKLRPNEDSRIVWWRRFYGQHPLKCQDVRKTT